MARNNDGIGLYTAAGSLVYKTAVPPWVPNYGADYHFGLDFQGNLKYYLMYKDASWTYGWQALFECDLPNFCGNYGICSTTTDQTGTTTAGCTGFALRPSFPKLHGCLGGRIGRVLCIKE